MLFLFMEDYNMQYTKFMANLYRYDGSNAKEISGVTRFETIGKNIKLTLKLCFAKRVKER